MNTFFFYTNDPIQNQLNFDKMLSPIDYNAIMNEINSIGEYSYKVELRVSNNIVSAVFGKLHFRVIKYTNDYTFLLHGFYNSYGAVPSYSFSFNNETLFAKKIIALLVSLEKRLLEESNWDVIIAELLKLNGECGEN
jgi:hypothetical protein